MCKTAAAAAVDALNTSHTSNSSSRLKGETVKTFKEDEEEVYFIVYQHRSKVKLVAAASAAAEFSPSSRRILQHCFNCNSFFKG